ncbi:hypothetical protein LTR24_000536 [Lithohypha guttulata]|uniref:Protein kinase domain-containing protein n=1 Tax=Lithohypha guttulata TaxID=1690604 RepID=A0ABR0KN47_9EURO|nr:hypothetical protein LTR24_000536 [Lithohypha guttulata]
MHTARTKAELQQHKTKLADSYSELLDEFSSPHLKHVGNYTLGRIIGTGSFGRVYLARHSLLPNTKVVLKAASRDDPNLAREIHHHRQFIHPHIARLYEVIVTEKTVWLVLEFCQGDELYNYLVTHGQHGLPVEKVQRIFAQLAGAVSYIHSKSCVHRDLKLENVLLDKTGDVKLVDFGFTREYEGKASYLQTFCGTICYSAPEMLKGEKYAGEKVDVWSLGIVLFALLTGALPFDEDDDLATKQKILKEDPTYPNTFPEQAKTLLSKMLSKRPLHRPTLAEVLNDPFLLDHAPAQQAILKLNQPAPFATSLEKTSLERMKAAGVDIDKVIENVLSQRCDALAGWWALLIEKETRKEARRERKRREKEAELKILRRLSGASSRLERIAPTLADVAEEGVGARPMNGTVADTAAGARARSTSRGRTNRRSTPQIMVSDLPRLPEGSAIESPGLMTPPPPIGKDPRRSRSASRPPLPPKERQRRRSSHLSLVATNPDLLGAAGPPNGVKKHRFGRVSTHNQNKKFLGQLVALKHWFKESAKRAASPRESKKSHGTSPATSQPTSSNGDQQPNGNVVNGQGHSRDMSDATVNTRNSYGATLTPVASSYSGTSNGRPLPSSRLDIQRTRHRQSLSPSPITPKTSFRRSSQGLRGRKSTSSSVSSVRSIPQRYTSTHSKASSVSSGGDSHDASTIQSPGSRSVGRSPHASLKILPATPSAGSFPAGVRNRSGSDERPDMTGSSVLFAKRKKSPFKGPMLNFSTVNANGMTNGGLGSPALFSRPREASGSHMNMGLLDPQSRRAPRAQQRKSLIITEEEEEPEEEIEEVDEFPVVRLGRGESVHSIMFLDDPVLDVNVEEDNLGVAKDQPTATVGIGQPRPSMEERLKEYERRHSLDQHAKDLAPVHRATTKERAVEDGVASPSADQENVVKEEGIV